MLAKRSVIGVDESGKGDFFGPLVVAAFLASDGDRERLEDYGVRDGKLISTKRILQIDARLRELFPHFVLIIDPASYNTTYSNVRNLNKLLAEGHARVIDAVLSDHHAELVVSDKFGKAELVENALASRRRAVSLKQLVRGERIVQVAAASILARAAFIRAMNDLSEKYGFEIPRGAAPKVDEAGREIVRRYGVEELPGISKIHFKNYQRVVNPVLFSG
ncbi:MAG: ribonuclease HIII [candidate division Zixibacteria bacterium]|nr:ribonuclease HIII [candidate division Zixibacteria bacterium]